MSEKIFKTAPAVEQPKKRKPKIKDLADKFLKDPSHETMSPLIKCLYWNLKKYAYGIVKDSDVASDMVIESFERAWEKRDMYDPEKAEFSTWLFRICRNNCLGYLYTKKKVPTVDKDISDLYDSLMNTNAIQTDKVVNPKEQFIISKGEVSMLDREQIIQKFYDASIYEISHGLDKEVGFILSEKLLKDKKIQTIADENGINVSTVKNRLYKGKEDLKEILKSKHSDLYEMYLDACGEKDGLLTI